MSRNIGEEQAKVEGECVKTLLPQGLPKVGLGGCRRGIIKISSNCHTSASRLGLNTSWRTEGNDRSMRYRATEVTEVRWHGRGIKKASEPLVGEVQEADHNASLLPSVRFKDALQAANNDSESPRDDYEAVQQMEGAMLLEMLRLARDTSQKKPAGGVRGKKAETREYAAAWHGLLDVLGPLVGWEDAERALHEWRDSVVQAVHKQSNAAGAPPKGLPAL